MLIREVCELVDGWVAAEEALFRAASATSEAAADAWAKVALAEVSRHAGARALRWAEVRPAVPIPVAVDTAADPGVVAALEELVAGYGEALRRAEPASDGPVMAVLRWSSLEASADLRRLGGGSLRP